MVNYPYVALASLGQFRQSALHLSHSLTQCFYFHSFIHSSNSGLLRSLRRPLEPTSNHQLETTHSYLVHRSLNDPCLLFLTAPRLPHQQCSLPWMTTQHLSHSHSVLLYIYSLILTCKPLGTEQTSFFSFFFLNKMTSHCYWILDLSCSAASLVIFYCLNVLVRRPVQDVPASRPTTAGIGSSPPATRQLD